KLVRNFIILIVLSLSGYFTLSAFKRAFPLILGFDTVFACVCYLWMVILYFKNPQSFVIHPGDPDFLFIIDKSGIPILGYDFLKKEFQLDFDGNDLKPRKIDPRMSSELKLSILCYYSLSIIGEVMAENKLPNSIFGKKKQLLAQEGSNFVIFLIGDFIANSYETVLKYLKDELDGVFFNYMSNIPEARMKYRMSFQEIVEENLLILS
ncbi:MAG: hypothetical protein ACTSWN_12505, partial [Promethearchaeota archaeon]